ncbi:MAG: DUF3313 domain-containing protein [Sphingobium sp.]
MKSFRPLKRRIATGITLALLVTLGGCASLSPVAYSGLASSSKLRPSAAGPTSRTPYAYDTDVNWRRYYKAILDPVEIYDGPDAQFVKLGMEDREKLADYMAEQFSLELGKEFELTDSAEAAALRVHLTLTGASPSKAVLGPLSRFDLAGGSYNAFQGIRGKEGTMTGSVIYAVEIYDSMSNKLLHAEVAKQYPNALNIGASFGALTAPMTGIRKGAVDLRETLTSRNRPR